MGRVWSRARIRESTILIRLAVPQFAMRRKHIVNVDINFAMDHDISEAAVTLSADIARVLYPLSYNSPKTTDAKLNVWKNFTTWSSIPFPLLSFLKAPSG